jgi:hypothetical protein
MKKFSKMVWLAVPAFVLAAAVGMTTMGCDDDTTSTPAADLAVSSQGHDLSVAHDLAKDHD